MWLWRPSHAGDANGDGAVDAVDLNRVALNWHNPVDGADADGDFNRDGVVDAADLNELALNWRFVVTPGVRSLAVVPEPTSAMLLTLTLTAMCPRPRPRSPRNR